MADGEVRAQDLAQETASTLSGNEQFVMFDSTAGKRADIDDVATYVAGDKTTLKTTNKTSPVAAINENFDAITDLKEDIDDLHSDIYTVERITTADGYIQDSYIDPNGEISSRSTTNTYYFACSKGHIYQIAKQDGLTHTVSIGEYSAIPPILHSVSSNYKYSTNDGIYTIIANADGYIGVSSGGTQDFASLYVYQISNNFATTVQLEARSQALKELISKAAFATTLQDEYYNFLNAYGFNLIQADSPHKVRLSVDTSTMKFTQANVPRTVYINAKPSTSYLIRKTASNAFRVSSSINVPAGSVSVSKTTANHTGTEIQFTTNGSDNYLVVQYGNVDSSHTEADIETIYKSVCIYEQ